ncbi:MAG: type II secretion system protein N [Pseudomonadota bacterium]
MKRSALLVSFLLFVALSISATYWALRLFKPVARQVIAPPTAPPTEIKLEAASGLFGGRTAAAMATNYQLKGVIAAQNGSGSVAILVADGQPAQIVGVGAEITPGVSVKEVHAQYVILSDGGVLKRVEWPEGSVAMASVDSGDNGRVLSAPTVTGLPNAPVMPAVPALPATPVMPPPAASPAVTTRPGSSVAAGLPPMPNENRPQDNRRLSPQRGGGQNNR